MSTEEEVLEIGGPRRRSWDHDPHSVVGRAQSGSVLVVASGSDDAHDIEEGGMASQSAVAVQSSMPGGRPSVRECLIDVPEEEMADLTLDVYNMFFLSNIKSQAFIYSASVLIIKMSLYGILLADITEKIRFTFRSDKIEAADTVKVAQFLLIPVAIVTQEELITSFFIFSHLKYSPQILERHPGAFKWKFVIAHCTRFLDGFVFLFLNTVVMLTQTNDVLGLFLNFAALMFLQTIDNIALQVCLDGYWTRPLQKAAQDVVDMKFALRHHYNHHCMQTSFVVVIWGAMIYVWAHVHFLKYA